MYKKNINETLNDTENFHEIENHMFNDDITADEVRTAISKLMSDKST